MKKVNQNLIAGLDIGTHNIRMAVGQMYQPENGGKMQLQLLGASAVASEGIKKGAISSIEDAVSSISACLERVERLVGVPVDHVWVGISDPHILTQASKGVVAVSKANSEITEEDINRALEAARTISTPLNYEVLHVLPRSFNIDGQTDIKDPIGMTGIRLEVDTHIILGATTQIKNLTKAVYRAGLEIDDLVLSILATAEAVATKRQRELGVVIVDIGGSMTSIAVFEGGDVLQTAAIPIGSEHITNDLAIGLRTSVDIAERVKIEYGECMADLVSKNSDIDLATVGAASKELVKRKYVSEIIEARVEEILQKVDEELRRIGRSGLLPAGVVLTGAGSKLPGLTEMIKKYLRLPATMGAPVDFYSITEKVNDPSFSTAVGLVQWGSNMQFSAMRGSGSSGVSKSGDLTKKLGGFFTQIKHWSKSLLP
ncbi:MAG: cell division protein FtsA [Candidatus Magasanikbacteria bacterium]|jgi:cell division protein FtsA